MKTASKSMAILVVLGALAILPTAAANLANTFSPGPGTGVCYAGPNPGYDECYGTVNRCGGGDGVGVGHWYYDRNGNSHTWCYAYVDLATAKFVNSESDVLP